MKSFYIALLAISSLLLRNSPVAHAELRIGVVDPDGSEKPFVVRKGRPFSDYDDNNSALHKLYNDHESPSQADQSWSGDSNSGITKRDHLLNIRGLKDLRDEPPADQTQPNTSNSQSSVWQVIKDNAELNSLKGMLEQTFYPAILDTVSTINYTVFAVVDSAWVNIPNEIQNAMNGPLERVLQNSIIQYHIVPNATITTNDTLANGTQSYETLSGFSVSISSLDGTMTVNKFAMNSSDLFATNGVVHLIDTVLLPSQNSVILHRDS
ncbi:FAS1 domain-containing protein [Umbelopsis sp. AD052]|nr:FAS1 domain-containing protein [Umbelopsis sp. AD052]